MTKNSNICVSSNFTIVLLNRITIAETIALPFCFAVSNNLYFHESYKIICQNTQIIPCSGDPTVYLEMLLLAMDCLTVDLVVMGLRPPVNN